MWIAIFLTIRRLACVAPQDLRSLEAHRKTLQLSGHGAELRYPQGCTVAAPKREGLSFHCCDEPRGVVLPQSLHALASHAAKSV